MIPRRGKGQDFLHFDRKSIVLFSNFLAIMLDFGRIKAAEICIETASF
jgi:hypothetical protein